MDEKREVSYSKIVQMRYQSQQLRKKAGIKDVKIDWADEEYAAELASPSYPSKAVSSIPFAKAEPSWDNRIEESPKPAIWVSRSRTIGYSALLLALLSLFLWPAFLGSAAVILGCWAYMGGSRGLGGWSIALGLLSFTAYFLLIPYYL